MREYTERQIEKYCQNRISGMMTQRKAYLDAVPRSRKWKPETVDSKASTLERSEKVRARLAELRGKVREIEEERAENACLTRVKKRQILAELATDADASASDRCRAIDLDNKMQGEYVEKVNVSGELNNPFAGMSTEDLLKLVGDQL